MYCTSNPKLVCGMTIESLSTFDTNSAISMQIEKGGIAALKVSLAALKSDKEKIVVTL